MVAKAGIVFVIILNREIMEDLPVWSLLLSDTAVIYHRCRLEATGVRYVLEQFQLVIEIVVFNWARIVRKRLKYGDFLENRNAKKLNHLV